MAYSPYFVRHCDCNARLRHEERGVGSELVRKEYPEVRGEEVEDDSVLKVCPALLGALHPIDELACAL